MPEPLPTTGQPVDTWWLRNWKWFVPVFMVGGLLLLVGLAVVLVNAFFGLMKSSDAYKLAVAQATAAPAVVQALGEPISEGLLVMGSINITGPSGKADLSIPISGPKGNATIYVAATKALGQWTIQRLVVEIESTGERIDLSPEPVPNAP